MRRLTAALGVAAALAAAGVTVTGSAQASTAPAAGPAVSVDLTTGRYPISAGIYGMNFADSAVAASIALPEDRWGGDSSERYDWRNGVTSTANDYYFENVPDTFDDAQSWCGNADHASYRAWQDRLDQDHADHAATVLTVPATGWVAKAPSSYGHPLLCAYPSPTVPSADVDPYDSCGNGKDASGNWIGGAVPDRTSVQVDDETLVGGWVDALKARYGDDAHGGVKWYEPGNEPALWSDTHHDLYGDHHVTAQEQWDRQSSVAAVVKEHDPTAHVLGPSEWGWNGYFCSDADTAGGTCDATSPDRALHGGMDQSAWWLEQAKAWEQAHGTRLVDAFDLHYYPQADTGADETRSLWDPTYTDPSWVDSTIRLIPRMHDWVDQHYPGTKISLGEYDFWHHGERIGGVMEADALGIFARERLDMAMLWQPVTTTDPTYWAFRMYRNADGHGRAFGTSYAPTHSADQSVVSAYSATRSNGSLTVMLVNKTSSPRRVPLSIKGFRNSTVHSFSYGVGLSTIKTDANLLELNGAVSTVVPAMGFQLLDLSGKVEQPLLTSALTAPASAPHGSLQTLTMTVKSLDGPSAVNPVLQLALPSGSRVSSVAPPSGWRCSWSSTPVLRCTASSLTAKATRSVTVRVVMPKTVGTVTSTLTVGAYRLERPVAAIRRSTRLT